MKTKVFLDLEDTVINNWNENLLINVQAVSAWLEDMRADFDIEVRVFSFAIWDQADKDRFEKDMKADLERAFNVEITEWLSVEEMQQIVEEWSGFRFEDRTDFMQMHGKHEAFVKVCLARERDTACFLLDDAVPNRTILDHERDINIELVSVQSVTGRKVGNEHAVARL